MCPYLIKDLNIIEMNINYKYSWDRIQVIYIYKNIIYYNI